MSYKLVRLPFHPDTVRQIHDYYLKGHKAPTAQAPLKIRVPRQAVQMLSTNHDDERELQGGSVMASFMLQPRQLTGIKNAKERNESYKLVLTHKQLKQMSGNGLFSSILSSVAEPLIGLASNAIGKAIKGRGEETDEEDDVDMSDPELEGTGIEDMVKCEHCKGRGYVVAEFRTKDKSAAALPKAPASKSRKMAPAPSLKESIEVALEPQKKSKQAATKPQGRGKMEILFK